jgi:hypothetical protein
MYWVDIEEKLSFDHALGVEQPNSSDAKQMVAVSCVSFLFAVSGNARLVSIPKNLVMCSALPWLGLTNSMTASCHRLVCEGAKNSLRMRPSI